MAVALSACEPIVGREVLDELRVLAESLRGRRLQNINSTAVGGGVAELLSRIIPLMRELGMDASWEVMRATRHSFK